MVVGSAAYFTLATPRPSFGLYVLGVTYNPLVPVAAALVAAPLAKFITKEPRSLRFMESVMAGIMQYFVWLALFVALTFVIGGFASTKTTAATVSTPAAVTGLIVIGILSYVGTFYLYPALYKFMRRRPPPRPAKTAKPEPAKPTSKSIVDRMDEASARELAGKGLDILTTTFDDVRSLYLHIPFCERKCEYCDFTSVAGATGSVAYMDALRTEVRRLGERLGRLTLDTVFIGGGTPSLVEPELIADLVATVRSTFSVAGGAEVTMEANPSSITSARARVWKAAGVNRVSIGVQSLEADALRFLGRVHDAGRAIEAIAEVRGAGFTSINCDLIYAVPGVGDVRWQRTLERVVAAGPTHVSCYELTVEPGTPLHTRVRRGLVRPVESARSMRQHRIAVDLLEHAGYDQYEVSNFALPGEECRHNLVYWHNGYYAAAGVGAHGHLPAAAAAAIGLDVDPGAVSVRHWHGRGIAAYGRAIRAGELSLAGSETVGPEMREEERVMLGLRLREGVSVGPSSLDEARSLEGLELVAIEGDRVRATARGEAVLNQVTLRLVGDRAA